jgi:hypothetical protein
VAGGPPAVSPGVAVAVVLVVVFVVAMVWAWREADKAERADGIEF